MKYYSAIKRNELLKYNNMGESQKQRCLKKTENTIEYGINKCSKRVCMDIIHINSRQKICLQKGTEGKKGKESRRGTKF